MNKYRIESKSGQVFGVYEGANQREAFDAMIADGGGNYGDETTGTEKDWVIKELPES